MEKINLTSLNLNYPSLNCQSRWFKDILPKQKQKSLEYDQWTQRNQGNPQRKTQEKTRTQVTQVKEKTVKVTKDQTKNWRVSKTTNA